MMLTKMEFWCASKAGCCAAASPVPPFFRDLFRIKNIQAQAPSPFALMRSKNLEQGKINLFYFFLFFLRLAQSLCSLRSQNKIFIAELRFLLMTRSVVPP
jgi:hypothetical protein